MVDLKRFILVLFLVFSPVLVSFFTPTTKSEETTSSSVAISSLSNAIVVLADRYEFRFNLTLTRWNLSRRDFGNSSLRDVRWRLYYNGTTVEADSPEYNAPLGSRSFSNVSFEGGIFLNFTCTSISEVPIVMQYFWFYSKFFVTQLSVANNISDKAIYVEKAKYVDDAFATLEVGEPDKTNFVFWGYKRRYQAQEMVDAEPPAFVYSNKSNNGFVVAPFKPDWSQRIRGSYVPSISKFNLSYELSADTLNADDITISTNNSAALDKVFFEFTSSDINQAFKNYASLYSQMYSLRPDKGFQNYWLTWYAGNGPMGDSPSEATVLSNATWIQNNLKQYYGFDGVLIDAMITDEVGDWLNCSTPRFPSGMKKLVNAIHAKGLKAGLWIAPLAVEKDGWINQTHPDTIAKNKTGVLLSSEMFFGGVKHVFYYLNPFDPWVQSRLRWVNQNISSWGFDFVKMDFLAGVLHELYEQNKTRYMIMEQAFKATIEGLDERIALLTCVGEFYNPAMVVNYVDRIWLHGNDLWNNWTNLIFKYEVVTQLTPFIRHFNMIVDSDALGYPLSDPHIPLSMAQFYSTYATVGGGTFEIGEKLSTIDNERLTIYKKHLPFAYRKWRPIEWASVTSERPPRVWIYNATMNAKTYFYAALFNTANSTEVIKVDLSSQENQASSFLVWNQYNSSFLGEVSSSFDVYLDANQTTMLVLTEKLSPTFLARSDLVTISVESLSTSSSDAHLQVSFEGRNGTAASIVVYSNKLPQYVKQNGAFSTKVLNGSQFDTTDECWYYDSTSQLLLVKVEFNSSVTVVIAWVDDIPPLIVNVERSLQNPEYFQKVLIIANVLDPQGEINTVTLSYDDSDWHNVTMNKEQVNLYAAEIPSIKYGIVVNYKVYASDTWGNTASSNEFSYTVVDSLAPRVLRVKGSTPQYNESAIILAEIEEPEGSSGLEYVTLSYCEGSQWQNLTMSLTNDLYRAEVPSYPANTIIQYKIYVCDFAGNVAFSDLYTYNVADFTAPFITLVEPASLTASLDEPFNVKADVTEPSTASGVNQVILFYSIDNHIWFPIEMTLKNGLYEAAIPQQTNEVTVTYYVVAFDMSGNRAHSSIYSYFVKQTSSALFDFTAVMSAAVGLCVSILIIIVALYKRKKKPNRKKLNDTFSMSR